MSTVICNSLFANEPEISEAPVKSYKIPEVKLSYVREVKTQYDYSVTSSDSLNKIFRPFFEDGEIDFHEVIFVAYFTRRNKCIGVQRIGTGHDSASICDCKALFAGALLCRASALAICHNHPSGALVPSPQDDILTKRVNDIAKFHELTFLDHLILTSESFYSYFDHGRI